MSDYATMPEPKTVRLERLLPGPIDRVWAFLTEADKRKRWFAGGDMAQSGAFTLLFQHKNLTDEPGPEKYKTAIEGFPSPCEMIRWEPPKALAFWWGEAGEKSLVTFELSEKGADVLFVITHTELPTRDEMVNVSGGWHAHTDILEALLRQTKPKPFWANIEVLEKHYEGLYPQNAAG